MSGNVLAMPVPGTKKLGVEQTPRIAEVPTVVSLADRRAAVGRGSTHDWLLGHLMQLVRYCERNELDHEEATLADAVDRLIATDRPGDGHSRDGHQAG